MANPYNADREWRKEIEGTEYRISTAIARLDRDFINIAFGAEDTYWAKPLPPDQIEAMLSQSTTLGLYKVTSAEKLQQVGMARFITDHITTSYLTDVYVLPEYRKFGLGKWIVACCKEVMDVVPAMRRGFLLASPGVELGKYIAIANGSWSPHLLIGL